MIRTVIAQGESIKSIAKSIEHLASSQEKESKAINEKLEKIVASLNKQEIIAERVSNNEKKNTESFSRVHARIDKIEKIQETDGCGALRLLDKKTETVNEKANSCLETRRKVAYAIVLTVLGSVLALVLVK